MFKNLTDGSLYVGEMRPGDRAATQVEIAAHQATLRENDRLGKSVTRCQARVALHYAGLLESVEAAMAAPEANPIAVIAWRTAQEFKRNSPTMLGMASALGLTDQQLDDLFDAASGVEV